MLELITSHYCIVVKVTFLNTLAITVLCFIWDLICVCLCMCVCMYGCVYVLCVRAMSTWWEVGKGTLTEHLQSMSCAQNWSYFF